MIYNLQQDTVWKVLDESLNERSIRGQWVFSKWCFWKFLGWKCQVELAMYQGLAWKGSEMIEIEWVKSWWVFVFEVNMNFIGNRVLRGPLLREPLMSPMILSLPTIAGAHLASTRGFIQRGVLGGMEHWSGRGPTFWNCAAGWVCESCNLFKLNDCIRDGKSMIVFAKVQKYIWYILMFFFWNDIHLQNKRRTGIWERWSPWKRRITISTSLSSGFTCELLTVVPCCTFFCRVQSRFTKTLQIPNSLRKNGGFAIQKPPVMSTRSVVRCGIWGIWWITCASNTWLTCAWKKGKLCEDHWGQAWPCVE